MSDKFITSATLPFDRLKCAPWKGAMWCRAQIKRDGRRLTVWKKPDHTLVAFSSDDRPDLEYISRFPVLQNITELQHWLFAMPPDTIVEGELYVTGQPASAVARALKGEPGHPGCLPRGHSLRWECFAVPQHEGRDLRFDQSINGDFTFEMQSKLIASMNMREVPSYSRMQLVALAMKHNPALVYNSWKGLLVGLTVYATTLNDCEGFVLKQAPYSGWFKVKGEDEIDCVITSWKEGNNANLGLVGSLGISVFDVETTTQAKDLWEHRIKVDDPKGIREDAIEAPALFEIGFAGGMNTDERLNMTEFADEDSLIGRVCKVRYQYVGSKKRLRHPRFVGWRDDKAPWDCLATQLTLNV